MNTKINNSKLESKLDQVLNPVIPSYDFVSDLQERLNKKAKIIVEYPNYSIPLVVISGGLFIGVLITWGLSKLYKLVSTDSQT